MIHYSTWSKHGGKWRDRRWEKHCQFSLLGMNTTTQTWSLKLKSNNFQSYPRRETAGGGKSIEYWVNCFDLLLVFFCHCWRESLSRNITKHLMSGPSGNKLDWLSFESWCFPWLCLGKTKLTVPPTSHIKCVILPFIEQKRINTDQI